MTGTDPGSGHTYYYNEVTGLSQWTVPTVDGATAAEEARRQGLYVPPSVTAQPSGGALGLGYQSSSSDDSDDEAA